PTTPDPATPRAVTLGQVLDRQRMPAGGLRIPLSSLNRHVFVCGATGGGKSQTVRGLLEAATKAGVPWLVVEPAKAEYRLMAARLGDSGRGASGTAQLTGTSRLAAGTGWAAEDTRIIRIRPGEADAIAAGLNPLEPAADGAGHRFPLQTHADLVRALFLAAFQSEEPFPQVLSAALTQVYEDAGWDLALGEPVTAGVAPGYPSLTDLQRTAEKVVLDIGYSDMVSADVLGFIKVRLSSLRLGTTGRFLEGGHPIDFGTLLRRNAILEIEDVGDDRDKAFLMGTVLIRLVEHLRLARRHQTGPEPGLLHLTVFEEAHRLLRRPDREGGAAAHAVELFAGLLAEIRAYGEGIVIAEQIPAKLIPDVIKNTAVKIAHRLPAADDREAVGATMNLTAAQSQYLVTLVPGEAAVSIDGMDRPVLARMPDGTAREAAATAPAGGAVPSADAADGNDMPGLVSAAAVASPRSVTCGAECTARLCTLRDMRSAQRALERHPGIVLWAELAVLAHLTGWPMPIPQVPLLDLLRAMPARQRDCAVSHAVDAAVASRTPVISAHLSPIGLASHVADAMGGRVVSGTWTCEKDEPQWLAPARPKAQRAVAFGLATPSAIERATGTSATDEDFQPQVAGHLEQFVDCQWPLLYLTGVPSDAAAT
ncbi:MAG TPA: ATP-binding protein, partial [Streptosporangiaceae bacterium]